MFRMESSISCFFANAECGSVCVVCVCAMSAVFCAKSEAQEPPRKQVSDWRRSKRYSSEPYEAGAKTPLMSVELKTSIETERLL